MSILEAAKKKLRGLAVSFALMADVVLGDKEKRDAPDLEDHDPSKRRQADPETTPKMPKGTTFTAPKQK